MFINVEKSGSLKLQGWFAAIILDNLYIRFYTERQPQEKILQSVKQLLEVGQTII